MSRWMINCKNSKATNDVEKHPPNLGIYFLNCKTTTIWEVVDDNVVSRYKSRTAGRLVYSPFLIFLFLYDRLYNIVF